MCKQSRFDPYVQFLHFFPTPLMMSVPMSLFVSVIIVQKEVFVSAVYRKCHCRNTQAGEAALKSIPSCERSGVSPCLAVHFISIIPLLSRHPQSLREKHSPSCPWIVCWCACCCCECFGVEAREIWSGSSPYTAQLSQQL